MTSRTRAFPASSTTAVVAGGSPAARTNPLSTALSTKASNRLGPISTISSAKGGPSSTARTARAHTIGTEPPSPGPSVSSASSAMPRPTSRPPIRRGPARVVGRGICREDGQGACPRGTAARSRLSRATTSASEDA